MYGLVLIAVAARFGIGKDFWINVLLTVCGYVPGTSSSLATHTDTNACTQDKFTTFTFKPFATIRTHDEHLNGLSSTVS